MKSPLEVSNLNSTYVRSLAVQAQPLKRRGQGTHFHVCEKRVECMQTPQVILSPDSVRSCPLLVWFQWKHFAERIYVIWGKGWVAKVMNAPADTAGDQQHPNLLLSKPAWISLSETMQKELLLLTPVSPKHLENYHNVSFSAFLPFKISWL